MARDRMARVSLGSTIPSQRRRPAAQAALPAGKSNALADFLLRGGLPVGVGGA
jgi:hypothetical protein